MSLIARLKLLFAKRFDVSETVSAGQYRKIILPGIRGNNVYLLQAAEQVTGVFDPAKWTNVSPKFHIVNNENELRGIGLNGDTVFYNGNSTVLTAAKPIAQVFTREVEELSFVNLALPVISGTKKFVLNFHDFYIDPTNEPERYYSMPSKKSGITGQVKLIGFETGGSALLKCVTKQAVVNYAPETPVGETNHFLAIDRNGYTFGTVSTPDLGNPLSDDVIQYELSNNVNDFQWFEITENAGSIDITKYTINTEI